MTHMVLSKVYEIQQGQRHTQTLHWHLSEVILNSFIRLWIQAHIRKEMSILSVAANVLSAVNILLMCIA